jgi:hypothetical protein
VTLGRRSRSARAVVRAAPSIVAAWIVAAGLLHAAPARASAASPPSAHTVAAPSAADPQVHAAFGRLLALYAVDGRVRYAAWAASRPDRQALHDYLARLQALDPAGLPRDDALAYWIDLYNAATLSLVLEHYPVRSIREIGALAGSPWKSELVRVAGRELSLDAIENEILRPAFHDPRVHFALNCASVSCPPLAGQPFVGARIDEQLDGACRRALTDPRWTDLRVDRIRVTPIFDWYAADFQQAGLTVREFIARYRPADRAALLAPTRPLEFADYDWSLNDAPAGAAR